MCKVEPNGDGTARVRFGRAEWLGVAVALFTIGAFNFGAMIWLVEVKLAPVLERITNHIEQLDIHEDRQTKERYYITRKELDVERLQTRLDACDTARAVVEYRIEQLERRVAP